MKARLIQSGNDFLLLLCTGKILTVSLDDARAFLMNFDDPDYYSGPGTWDYENLTIASYRGSTVAFVEEDGTLCVQDAVQYRKIIEHKESKYLTVAEYAELHGKQTAIIRRFCQNGRISGVVQKGKTWLIPEDSPYPPDARVRKSI